jgi:hypothetical protein
MNGLRLISSKEKLNFAMRPASLATPFRIFRSCTDKIFSPHSRVIALTERSFLPFESDQTFGGVESAGTFGKIN